MSALQKLCTHCLFWQRHATFRLAEGEAEIRDMGECRRYPPSPKVPLTHYQFWCGEWRSIAYPLGTRPHDGSPAPGARREQGGGE